MFLGTYIQYKLRHCYTFIIGIALAAIHITSSYNNHHNNSPSCSSSHPLKPIPFLSHYYRASNRVMKKKNAPVTEADPMQNNKPWIMKSKCRCGQCEIDISWNTITTSTAATNNGTTTGNNSSMTTTVQQPNDTYTLDCYCSKCRIYHGSVFTSYVQVSKEQVQIRKAQSNRMKYYRHTCDEIIESTTFPNSTTVVERIFCSKCYSKLATTATTTITAAVTVNNITNTATTNSRHTNTPHLPNNTTTTTTTINQLWYINMGCIVDKSILTDFALYWRNHRIPKQISQKVSWYPAQPKYKSRNGSTGSDDDDNDEDDEEEEEEEETEENDIDIDNENDDAEEVEETNYDENSIYEDDSNNEGTSDDDNKSNDYNSNDSRSNDVAADDDEYVRNDTSQQQPRTPIRGGCACGRVQYQIQQGTIDVPNELPICYCRLCRQMSGSAFVPWIYMSTSKKNNFQWIIDYKKTLKLLRTTSFGKRHVCTHCGTVITILYNSEKKDYIWPTAASIYDLRPHDITLNNNNSSNNDNSIVCHNSHHKADHPIHDGILRSVRHIYCQDNAIWYQIPKDRLPRSFNND